MISRTEDEAFVRSVWEKVYYSGNRVLAGDYIPKDARVLSGLKPLPETLAWYAAAANTRAVLEEVRHLEEEIKFIDSLSCVAQSIDAELARQRTLTRLESALLDTKRGMKQD